VPTLAFAAQQPQFLNRANIDQQFGGTDAATQIGHQIGSARENARTRLRCQKLDRLGH
jgi:hypothetical protein